MAYSIGIWAVAQSGGGVVRYRWESDAGGNRRTGFAVLDEHTSVVRPSDEQGTPIGTLAVTAEGGVTGEADVDHRQFSQVAAAILAALKKSGSAPQTAHRYFG
jgi:hypothetical protein